MRRLRKYHHFKRELIDPTDRVTNCERYVTDLLLTSDLSDSRRDGSICWELKHQASTIQFAKVLAMKRGLPVDICVIGLMFHDIYSIIHGKYEKHARLSTPIAMEILQKMADFSEEELNKISRIIDNHSDKHVWSDDPFQEIGKDVDVFDCFLYEGAFDYYLRNKPLYVFKHYLRRVKNVYGELGLPTDPRFNLLDDYGSSWFQLLHTFQSEQIRGLLAILLELSKFRKDNSVCLPPFCIVIEDKISKFYGCPQRWTNYAKDLANQSGNLQSDKKLGTLSLVLYKFLKSETKLEVVNQLNSLMKEGIISEENYRKAANILEESQGSSDARTSVLLFWPLIDIYESLTGKEMINRLEELGIKLSVNKRNLRL